MKLSAAIICRNEENSLPRCLESIKGADEIVVVDTGSEDNTVQVARGYTGKVFTDYRWTDDFSAARNHAISKCTGDWILVIDADNRLVNRVAEVKAECEKAERQGYKTVSIRIGVNGQFSHHLPYLFRRDPEIYFKGQVHNHLTRDDNNLSQLSYECWYSDSHRKDPDRSFRILKRVNQEDPNLVREKFYLGREYYGRRLYADAIRWFEKYLGMNQSFVAEIAEVYLLMSKCCWHLREGDLARATCAKAINVNTHFREAILWLAEMSGPINRERWLEFAEGADNSNVLFQRAKREWTSEQYDEQFKNDSDMSRYLAIHEEIAQIVGDASVLDIGCGVAALAEHVRNYSGFDFSAEAVKIAAHPNVRVGSAYERENFVFADYYVCTEVLEHLDDLRVIANIPAGQRVIFSVPSFDDESHVRMFTEKIIRARYGNLFDIGRVIRFNWHGGRWVKGGGATQSYILLVQATKRAP